MELLISVYDDYFRVPLPDALAGLRLPREALLSQRDE